MTEKIFLTDLQSAKPIKEPFKLNDNKPKKKRIKDYILKGPSISDYYATPPEILIDPFFRRGNLMLVYAQAGVGKTWLTHQMALSLSSVSGGLFFEYIVPESRKVLLIDGEMSISDIQYRLKKLNKGESLPENLSLLSSEFLALDNKTLNINEQEYQEQIIEALEENKPDVVVFDNLSSLSYGNDENSNSDLDLFLKFIGKLRHKGIAVVIVHHAGKNGKLRGASRLEDRMDYTIKLTKGKKTKKGGACFDFEFTKCRGKTPHPYKVSVELIEHDGKLSWCHEKVEKKITINDEILHYLSMGTFSTQKEIADKMDKDKSIISKGVKALKEKNYINGEQKLTALGKEYHTEIKGHFNDYDYTDVL